MFVLRNKSYTESYLFGDSGLIFIIPDHNKKKRSLYYLTSWRTDVSWFFKKLKATNQLFKFFSFFFYYYFTKNLQWTKIHQKNLQQLIQKDHPQHPDHRQQLQQDVRKILASKTTKTICFYVEFAASTFIMNAVEYQLITFNSF